MFTKIVATILVNRQFKNKKFRVKYTFVPVTQSSIPSLSLNIDENPVGRFCPEIQTCRLLFIINEIVISQSCFPIASQINFFHIIIILFSYFLPIQSRLLSCCCVWAIDLSQKMHFVCCHLFSSSLWRDPYHKSLLLFHRMWWISWWKPTEVILFLVSPLSLSYIYLYFLFHSWHISSLS